MRLDFFLGVAVGLLALAVALLPHAVSLLPALVAVVLFLAVALGGGPRRLDVVGRPHIPQRAPPQAGEHAAED